MGKLTDQDAKFLRTISKYPDGVSSYLAADAAGIRTMYSKETAARHLIKLTKLGLAEKLGTRVFPMWRITDLGRATLEKDRPNGE